MHHKSLVFLGCLLSMLPATLPAEPAAAELPSDAIAMDPQCPLRKVAVYELQEARYGVAAVSLGDFIYIIGGSNDAGTPLDTIERFEPKTGRSEKFARLKIARQQHRAVVVGDKIYVLGGDSRQRPYPTSNPLEYTVEVIDPATRTVAFAPSMPTAKARFSCATVGGLIYVIGGVRLKGSNFVTTNTTEVFDPSSGQWSAGINMPTVRQAEAVTVGDQIVVAGGNGPQPFATLDVVETYFPTGKVWHRLPPLSETVNPSSIVFLGHQLFLFSDGTRTNWILAYDLVNKVSQAYPLPYDHAQYAATVVHDGKIYLLGGTNVLALRSVQVFVLNTEKQSGGSY